MDRIVVRGGNRLQGTVGVEGAKNAALPILAASLLSDSKCTLTNIPHLDDVYTMLEALRRLGAQARFTDDNAVEVLAEYVRTSEAPYDLVRKMRASFLLAGPLLARRGRARMALPGGCAIGTRPVDLHLKGFACMGAHVVLGNGYLDITSKRLTGGRIYLDFPSVGATENIIMAAVLAKGETLIENAAIEPEVVDLANYLCSMGAMIKGAGTSVIKVTGVRSLNEANYQVIPDRIEAGTYMIAAATTGGDVTLENVMIEHLKALISKLRETGAHVEERQNSTIRVICSGYVKPIDLKTMPYPGFPTDLQPQMMALLCTAGGCSVITETVFDNRFLHAEELRRMGAWIKIDGRSALIKGVRRLSGARVRATDLRAGAALVLAGLSAAGVSEITDVYHIDRGYSNFVPKLWHLGADIRRLPQASVSMI